MRTISLWTMIILYVAAGINHFVHPGMYKAIMPRFIPSPWNLPLVQISGACEILFALLLIPASTRTLAVWLIIALLIAIFPANIQMSVDYYHRHNPSAWLTILRLPIQVLLIVWAYSLK